jgi:periplasmic divalent cation tolerance protein
MAGGGATSVLYLNLLKTPMENHYAIAITTVGNGAAADNLARALVESRLAACVQVMPIQSYYTWQEKLNIDDERMLMIKCRHADVAEIETFIRARHDYEIPEIIAIPIVAGFPPYLDWIDRATHR